MWNSLRKPVRARWLVGDEKQALLEARLTVRIGGQTILDGVELRIGAGQCVGLVGQSGSGKSTLSLALLGLVGPNAGVSGWLRFEGGEILGQREREWRKLRGRRIALVLQSASAALNPALRIETQFKEAWRAHSEEPWGAGRAAAFELMRSFDLPAEESFLKRYPSQVSIGQAQRLLIAMALLHRPALLIADEVTSALDAVTQREVLGSLRRANQEWGTAVLHITHDLMSVPELCSHVLVLDRGRVVEDGRVEEVFANPRHAHTRQLVECLHAAAGRIGARRAEPDAAGSQQGWAGPDQRTASTDLPAR